ncbi:magnesium protoporphyrin IX methyltransferase [Aestuariivirga sp.]|jgi:magnesium-protoporphyrin O-methyltransferase|uniref:magnesium protoporphyrin IX methyltransferase n=1 Tax=Aestuariivirga sp. TaxID=2650926 RepID=UPI00378347FB
MSDSYLERRSELETYFDRTAAVAWSKLTSDAPVSGIRATVRAGRNQMRATLLSFLPDDMRGLRVLDAGCGTGALAVEAARRGADVTAVDISPTLIGIARERLPERMGEGRIQFIAGDMLELRLGSFDHVVAMDSLIHYSLPDMISMLARLSSMSRQTIHFTYAPRTPILALMHMVGKLFPRSDRSPRIVPHGNAALQAAILQKDQLQAWGLGRTKLINSGFYISQAQELVVR